MLPEWAIKILIGLGFPGLFIFLETTAILGLVAYIRKLQGAADKTYGFRLAERDTLNTTLNNTAEVLRDVLKAMEERNEITEEQADLIAKQAHAFELMKVALLGQYENIHEFHKATALTVAALAESLRVVSSMVLENRTIAKEHVLNVVAEIQNMKNELVKVVRDTSDANTKEMRSLLGNVTRVEVRRKKTP